MSLLQSIESQDYDTSLIEVIISDGQSDDGTIKLINSYNGPLKVIIIENKERITPLALNLAIQKATNEVIIRMDCHANYPKDYISSLIDALHSLPNAENVGVSLKTLPAENKPLSLGISYALSSPIGVGSSQFRTGAPREAIKVDTVPFGCFKKDLFERIGLFNPLLVRNQDDEFNNRIRKNGGDIYLLPSPVVKYFARNTLGKLCKMYYQYGLYKPLSNKIAGQLSNIRQLIPSLFISFLALSILSPVFSFKSLYISLPIIFLYISLILIFGLMIVISKKQKNPFIIPYFMISVFLIHISYGYGYIKGLSFLAFKKGLQEKSLSR